MKALNCLEICGGKTERSVLYRVVNHALGLRFHARTIEGPSLRAREQDFRNRESYFLSVLALFHLLSL
jgi:hypothetical protein